MHAYNVQSLQNLLLLKEAKTWKKSGIISADQLDEIKKIYTCSFYHPNWIIRLLLFLATLLGLSGVSGILALMVNDAGTESICIMSIMYGLVSLFTTDLILIRGNNHYKSGVTEALLYHSIGFIIGGIFVLTDFKETPILWASFLVCSLIAWRYLDLLCTIIAFGLGAYIFFDALYSGNALTQQLIPVLFIVVYASGLFLVRRLKSSSRYDDWHYVLLTLEVGCLIIVYAAGNYFVVRELTVNLIYGGFFEEADIPFAWLFYFLTVAIPVLYLYVSIRKKDIVLLRVSLAAIAFSVFTFKYYFSLGHPEITLTVAGLFLLLITAYLLIYLKSPKNGFTRENIFTEKWGSSALQAIVISQTLGGNKVTTVPKQEGGSFGGGGASGDF
jgi:hypothetical protein